MRTRLTIYIVAAAALLTPSLAFAYGESYYQPYYQGYYQAAYAPWDGPYPLIIGRQYDSNGGFFQGYIDEVRFSNTARWSGASFTPPTSQYTSDANTLLLLHMNDDKASFYNSSAGGTFAYPPPAGFKAVSTTNLPSPVTDTPSSYFNATAYSGNNASVTVTTGFAPDLVWVKDRVATYWNLVTDTARGANNSLFTNSNAGVTQNDSNGWLTAFGYNSFTVGGQCLATPPNTNLGGNTYISWAWKRSVVAGIDVVSYTGDGNITRSVPHGLGTKPDILIVKSVDQPGDWYVWTSSLSTPASFLKLDTRDAETTSSSPFGADLLPTMTGATTAGVTMSASSIYNSTYDAWKAADKDNTTYWQTVNTTPNPYAPQWIRADFGSGNTEVVGAYSIRTYASSNYLPTTFTLQGSNDATSCTSSGSVWTVVDTEEYAPWRYTGADTVTFTVPAANRASYRCYRVSVTNISAGGYTIITELNMWDATVLPDASNFVVKNTPANNLNATGGQYVAYVFANREGFQTSGTYIGNASSDGPFVYTGFKPKLVMVKNTSVPDADWVILDSTRSTTNPRDLKLSPDSAAVENDSTATGGANTNQIDFYTNGFKLRSGNYDTNTYTGANCYNGNPVSIYCYKYAYIAFADVPFKSANTGNGYTIANALRLDASRSAYLSHVNTTSSSFPNRGTMSFWMKRGNISGSRMTVFSDTGNTEMIGPSDTANVDTLWVRIANADMYFGGTAAAMDKMRDPSAWDQIVVAWDTSSVIVSNRVHVYRNGVELPLVAGAYPATINATVAIFNNGTTLNIGRDLVNNAYFFDGYIADFNAIDGFALTPTAFGAFDGNGYWKPKAYPDVYGNSGFFLKFSDASNLGADSSPKVNNFKPQNLNSTTFDQVTDTPTNNFATVNQMYYYSPTYGKATVTAGGLAANGNHGGAAGWRLTSGKWYWEYVVGGYNNGYPILGLFKDPNSGDTWRAYPGHNNDQGIGYESAGFTTQDAFTQQSPVSGFWNDDVIGVAYDADSGKVYFSRNGVWQGDNNSLNLIPKMNAQTTNGVTMTASTYYTTGYEPWRAGDRVPDASNYWYTYGHTPSSAPDWLRVDFGSGNSNTVTTYSIKGYSSGTGYEPINFTLEGTNDATSCAATGYPGGSVWTVLDTETNVLWTATGQVQYFPVPVANQAAYRCYRVKVTGAGTIAAPTYYLIIDQLGLYNTTLNTDPATGLGYNGIVQGGVPGFDTNYGRSYVNFGQGGTPGITFSDSSNYARPMVESASGFVVATTSVSKFSGWSFYDDSNLAGALTTPATPGLNPAGDFTIDLWAYPTNSGTSGGLFSRDASGSVTPYMIYQNGTSFTYYGSSNGSGWDIAGGSTICSGITMRTWYHLAVVRSGNTYSLYCNGTRTTTFTSALRPWPNQYPIAIGRQYNGGAYYNGYIDEVRFSDTARWTGASFTPPTSEYSADANTLLLLHMTENKAGHYSASAGGYFAEQPPTGFKAVSTNNLPTPAAVKPTSYFDSKAYTGSAGAPSYDVATKGSYITVSNNNYDANSSTNCCWANGLVYSGPTFSSGKWYAEFKITGNYPVTIGVGDASKRQTPEATLGYLPTEYSYYPYNGTIGNNNVFASGYPGLTAGDTVMVAVDMTAGKIWFGKNGTWLGTGNPSTGANPQYSGLTGTKAFAVDTLASAGTIQANFGQSGRFGTSYYGAAGGYFTYAPPTGFQALPTTSSQDVAMAFNPDLVWVKNRTAVYPFTVNDSARTAGYNLFTNSNSAQVANDINGSVLSFNGTGFTVGGMCAATGGVGSVAAINHNYIAWAWKESPIAGFDIESYTGNGSSTQAIAHTLGTTPDLVISKRTDSTGDWFVWSAALTKLTSPLSFETLNNTNARTLYPPLPGTDSIPEMTANPTSGVTMTASVETSSQFAWYAGDKQGSGRYWQANPAPTINAPQWLRVDYGASVSNTIGAYSIQNYYAGNNYQPSDFKLQGSNDATTCSAPTGTAGTVWTTVDARTAVYWSAANDTKTFYVAQANQAAYRCYRLYVTRTQDNNPVIVTEFNLWPVSSLNSSSQFIANNQDGNAPANANVLGADAVPTMTANPTGTVKFTASVETNPAWYAGDKQGSGRYWQGNPAPTVVAPQWLRVDLGAAAQSTVAAYSIQNYYAGNNYQPTDFQLQGSNDATTCSAATGTAGAVWTTLDIEQGIVWSVANDTKTFYVPQVKQAAYRCYRVYITRTQDNNGAIITELNLWQATASGAQYVSYIFSNREGLQKSGTYIGNGSANGPVVYTGFKPRYVMIKDASRGDSNAQWIVLDSARSPLTTTIDTKLAANSTVVENDSTVGGAGVNTVEFISNGFKIRTSNCGTNCNQENFIYLAFAEVPFKTANTAAGNSIASSVRFDSNINAYLSRNVSQIGNQQIHTFSAWIKRGTVGSDQAFYTANTGGTDSTFLEYKFNSSDQIVITGGSTVFRQTVETYRDTTKWYHIVITVDTTQAAPKDRIRLYVDGKQVTNWWCTAYVCPAE